MKLHILSFNPILLPFHLAHNFCVSSVYWLLGLASFQNSLEVNVNCSFCLNHHLIHTLIILKQTKLINTVREVLTHTDTQRNYRKRKEMEEKGDGSFMEKQEINDY